ncbi:MAG: beta-ketoacyl-ACP synthase II [Acidobacteriota bacterium]|nr:MAG: beta-ketoacyl-ACP synthase II [Acidobacteriota bacterium]
MARRRAVITGIGLLTPLGLDADTTWRALVEGRSGIGPITRFDASPYTSRIAGEIKDFDPLRYMDRKEARKGDAFIQYALVASGSALRDSGLSITDQNRDRIGVIIGSGIGGLPMIEDQHKILLERGPDRVSPFFIPAIIVNLASGQVSIKHGLRGPNSAVCTACSTGAHCIGDAAKLIERGEVDAMLAGGAEAAVSPLSVAGFASLRALSRRNDEPERASRPFDRDRDGFVIAEGAGVVVLEEREAAKARGARVYAEVAGYGMSADAYHLTAPDEDGNGAVRAMEAALRDAQITTDKVDYVNAHGTSTPQGDTVEAMAIKRVFGDHAKKLLVSSTKSMMGHALGAAGGIETSVCALALHRGTVPPTTNLDHPDEGCDLNYVPHESVQRDIRVALNNSFGFGGTNACLLLKKV